MADRFKRVFAESGDTAAIPDDTTAGTLSIQEGWPSNYEIKPGEAGSKFLSRAQNNELFNKITGNIKLLQDQGAVDWYDDVAYPQWSSFRYAIDGEFYVCHTPQAAGTLPTDFSSFINSKYFGSYAYAVSQLAGGDVSKVGFIYIGQTINAFDYLIYEDGRIYQRLGATGTISASFDPSNGSDGGLSRNIVNMSPIKNTSQIKTSIDIGVDTDIVLGAVANSYGVLEFTNTNGSLTQKRSLTFSDESRFITVYNKTLVDLNIRASVGAGVVVLSGMSASLLIDEGTVEKFNMGLGQNQKRQVAEITDTGALFSDGTPAFRETGIDYLNGTGQPIEVSVTQVPNTSIGRVIALQVGGVNVDVADLSDSSSKRFSVSAVVADGETYRVNETGGAYQTWTELR